MPNRVLEINNVKGIETKFGSMAYLATEGEEYIPMITDQLSERIKQEVAEAKHMMGVIDKFSREVEKDYEKYVATLTTEQLADVIIVDIPLYIKRLDEVGYYDELSNFSLEDSLYGINIPYDENRDIKFESGAFAATRNLFLDSVPKADIERVWRSYLNPLSKRNENVQNLHKLTETDNSTVRDLYVLECLCTNLLSNPSENLTINLGIYEAHLKTIITAANAAIKERLEYIKHVGDNVNIIWIKDKKLYTTQDIVDSYVELGGSVDDLTYVPFYEKSNITKEELLIHRDELAVKYKRIKDDIILNETENKRAHLVMSYKNIGRNIIKPKPTGPYKSIETPPVVSFGNNVLRTKTGFDLLNFQNVAKEIVVDELYANTDVNYLVERISIHKERGIDIETSIAYAVEDLIIHLLCKDIKVTYNN